MKKIGIILMILGILIGIGMMFTGVIMLDLQTKLECTSALILILGVILSFGCFIGILGISGVMEW